MSQAPQMAENHLALIADRVAGDTYPQLSEKYGLSITVCRYYCKKAAKSGMVTREQIRWVPKATKPALEDMAYNQKWLARVRSKVTISDDGCWLWKGHLNPVWGYGDTNYRNKSVRVHRKVYEITHAVSLSRDQYVCHTCDVRHCCNPDHLWIGTNSLNQLDASRKGRHPEIKKTHCPKGHPYDEKNTTWKVSKCGRPARECKECVRIKCRRYWESGNGKARQRARRETARAQGAT